MANVGNTKVNSVGVGSSSTDHGGKNAGGKHKAVGKTPRPAKVASGAGGGPSKLPSGTYKA